MSLTQTIGRAVLEEGKNQIAGAVTSRAAEATTTFSVLSNMPWPVVLLMILISLWLAWQAYKIVKWLLKVLVVTGIAAIMLTIIVKMIH